MTHNNNDDKKPDYTVGYGKPPKENQFKKGQSGNPKGKAKGTKNLSTLIEADLKSTISITEQGVQKNISKKEAFARQIVNKGIAGHQKFTPLLADEIRQQEIGRVHTENRNSMPIITPDITDEEVERIYKETLKNVTPT